MVDVIGAVVGVVDRQVVQMMLGSGCWALAFGAFGALGLGACCVDFAVFATTVGGPARTKPIERNAATATVPTAGKYHNADSEQG